MSLGSHEVIGTQNHVCWMNANPAPIGLCRSAGILANGRLDRPQIALALTAGLAHSLALPRVLLDSPSTFNN